MPVAHIFSGGVAICYVFPILWISSNFHIRGRSELAAHLLALIETSYASQAYLRTVHRSFKCR